MFAVGAILCLVNIYTSWLRYPLHRIRGGAPETFRWASGVPVVASLLVMIAWTFWLRHRESLPLNVTAWVLALLDTGGVHWFLIVIAADRFKRRGGGSA